MGEQKTIEVTIDPQGKANVETKGFSGSGCMDASKFIERALGKSTGDKKTPEFYNQAKSSENIRQR